MSILIIESCERKDCRNSNSSIVHVKNSLMVQDLLECDLISHISEIPLVINNRYTDIICSYASPYMKYNAYMELIDANPEATMYWLVNDHDLEDNVLLRNYVKKYRRPYNVICNNPREGYRHWILGKKLCDKKLKDWIGDWHTINLNTLVFDENQYASTLKLKSGCVYYGTFRKHRIKDMSEYNGANYTISTSTKNQTKFKDAGVVANFADRLDILAGELSSFKSAIYFEDSHTHENYAYMANRWYECVMNNVLLFFDFRCVGTIEKSGYIVNKWLVVNGADELNSKLKTLETQPKIYVALLRLQRTNVPKILLDRSIVCEEIKNIFKKGYTYDTGTA